MTFIAVVKGGGNKILLSFSNNTSSSRFYEFIGGGTTQTWQVSNSSAPVLVTLTGNKTNLGASTNYHIIAFVVDGRAGGSVAIYVDGAKQPEIHNATTIAMWNAIGRGTAIVTSINVVRIGSRDYSSTDIFHAVRGKHMTLYSSALPKSTLYAKFKYLSNKYSIPLITHYE